MVFNPDVPKKTREVAFSGKAITNNQATVYFNNVPIMRGNLQKSHGLFLDSQLNLYDHINEKI